MTSEKLIESMTDVCDSYISDAQPGIHDARKSFGHHKRRRVEAAILVAVLVLAGSIAAFASGIITIPFSLYKSSDVQTKTKTMIIDGVEVDSIEVSALTPAVYSKEITGAIMDDARQILKQKIENSSTLINYDGSGRPVDTGVYEVSGGKEFASQQEALDYIGCKYYEAMYYPFDNAQVFVNYNATVSKDTQIDQMLLNTCMFDVRSTDSDIIINEHAFISFHPSKNGKYCHTGLGEYPDDGSWDVSLYTNRNGYNGAVAKSIVPLDQKHNFGWPKADAYVSSAAIAKNNAFYSILVVADWEDRAEAENIINTWLEHF